MNVFITGASSGIGAALAQLYAARGDHLALVARRGRVLHELAASLPREHSVYSADVTDTASMRTLAEREIAAHGLPDVVIASAGVSIGTLTERPEDFEFFKKVIDTNVTALFATFSPFAGKMRERGSGRLVGIASVAGIRGLPGSGAYSASKAAVIGYCESLRVELRNSGVKVVTIVPGYIRTPMTAKNPYGMPFLMEAGAFAARAVAAIDAGASYRVIPWQMGLVARLLHILPNWLYDPAFANIKRKPRADKSAP
ncbi:MAG: short-chain dehydrogenase [Acidobacteria bacterium]|nr:short-chain dehydrogenase [Acidobacteriota bacterium]